MANKSTQLLPAYMVVGDDLLKREEVLKKLRMRLEKFGDLSFNSDKFDGALATAEEIVAACKTIPFASEKRLVVVENASKLKKKDAQTVADYLAEPLDTTVLIAIADSVTKDFPLSEAIKKIDPQAWIDCTIPKKKEDLYPKVIKMAALHGINLSSDGAVTLVELVGSNTVHIEEELKKISLTNLYTEQMFDVGKDKIEELVAHISEYEWWDFVDAFARRDANTCARMLQHMSSNSPISLLLRCVDRIRQLICVHSVAPGGGDAQGRVAKELGLPSNRAFTAKYRIDEARKWSLSELEDALISAMDVERKMKTGSDQQIAFDLWLYSTISGHSSLL